MRTFSILTLFVFIAYINYASGKIKGPKSFFKPSKPMSSSRFRHHSSGLSMSKKNMLLGAGGLAAAYVGFKVASMDRHDWSRYTVCEGNRYEMDPFNPNAGRREYKYTVCPQHQQYCCQSDDYKGERCCSGGSSFGYGPRRGAMFGSLFGTVVFALGIGLAVYCCCCRRRQKQAPATFGDTPPTNTFVTMGGGYAPGRDPAVPTYPVPVAKPAELFPPQQPPPPPYYAPPPGADMQPPPYPANSPAPPLGGSTPYPASAPGAPGSGWGSDPTQSYHHPPAPPAAFPYPPA